VVSIYQLQEPFLPSLASSIYHYRAETACSTIAFCLFSNQVSSSNNEGEERKEGGREGKNASPTLFPSSLRPIFPSPLRVTLP
jgi:hypothetical protein